MISTYTWIIALHQGFVELRSFLWYDISSLAFVIHVICLSFFFFNAINHRQFYKRRNYIAKLYISATSRQSTSLSTSCKDDTRFTCNRYSCSGVLSTFCPFTCNACGKKYYAVNHLIFWSNLLTFETFTSSEKTRLCKTWIVRIQLLQGK